MILDKMPPARPPPPNIQQSQQAMPAAPYPIQMQGMPVPMQGYGGYNFMPPMPASFNPYATMPAGGIPYPQQFNFPQAPGNSTKLNLN
jgi:hypothetical protein